MATKEKKNTDIIDLATLFQTYKKNWWWFPISVVLCCCIGYVYIKTHNTEYMVRANVLISNDDTQAYTSISGLSDLFGSSANVEDEVFVINSHTVLRDVARQLGLNKTHVVKTGFLSSRFAYPTFPVDVLADPGISDTLSTDIVFKVSVNKEGVADIVVKANKDKIADVEDVTLPATLKTSYGRFVVDLTKYAPKDEDINTTITLSSYDAVAEELAEDIIADKASKRSNIVEMNLRTTNVDYGKAVLNAVMQQYNVRALAEKNLQGEKTAKFLDSRLALISNDLDDAEMNIQSYKQSHNITDVGTEAAYNMRLRGSQEFIVVELETTLEIIKMTRDFLSDPANKYELIPLGVTGTEEGFSDESIKAYNELLMDRMALAKTARSNNAALLEMDARLAAMRSTIVVGLDRLYKTTTVKLQEARNQLGKAMGKLGDVPTQEREYLGLHRQQMIKQQLFIFLLQRREDTAMTLANAIPKGQIVDEAFTLSQPVSMSKKVVLAIAFIIGLLIPLVLLYIKQMIRSKFDSQSEFKRISDVPVLGEVCKDTTGEALVVREGRTSSTVELFRALRASMHFLIDERQDKVILVTSTRSGEGKSFVSVNLGATFALLGKRVLIVGMDIRNPQLANYLGLQNGRGVTTYLANPSADLNSMIVTIPEVKNLSVLVAGPIPPNPGELLASPAMNELMTRLREMYDYIIIDSAPVGMVSDTFNIAHYADLTVYVTRANYTTRADVSFLNEIYVDKRLRKMAVVINGAEKKQGYGYGYGAHSQGK